MHPRTDTSMLQKILPQTSSHVFIMHTSSLIMKFNNKSKPYSA